MQEQKCAYEFSGHMAIVRIASPKNNIYTWVNQLFDALDQIRSNQDIRSVVVTDTDQNSFRIEQGRPETEGHEFSSSHFRSLARSVCDLDRPVIAAIHGDAMGLGLELVLACDIRLAAETSLFAMPQIKQGLLPSDGGAQRLARLVGRSMALEMILTGREINAQEAWRIGLINKVLPQAQVLSEATTLAQDMAAKSPIALRYVREAIHKGMDMTLEQGLRLEADLYFLTHSTTDRTEGIRAFQEKRKPAFNGR
jgi:enoyl-CoA hydratase/carnithine racemase